MLEEEESIDQGEGYLIQPSTTTERRDALQRPMNQDELLNPYMGGRQTSFRVVIEVPKNLGSKIRK